MINKLWHLGYIDVRCALNVRMHKIKMLASISSCKVLVGGLAAMRIDEHRALDPFILHVVDQLGLQDKHYGGWFAQ